MLHHRLPAVALAVLAVLGIAAPVAAAGPGDVTTTGGPPTDEPWIAPTAVEQRSLDLRLDQADSVRTTKSTVKRHVHRYVFCESKTTRALAATTDCAPPSFTLLTYARRQSTDFYCGPATAQVIINHSRGIFRSKLNGEDPDTNYRTQSYIAKHLTWYNSAAGRWENTDTIRQTNAYMLKTGLNDMAKLPDGFIYAVVETGTGSQWHSKVITDTQKWHMAFGAAIKMTSTSQRLSSWADIPSGVEVHHWITIRGYSGLWDGTSGPKVYYNDSSDQQGGGTGSFIDPSIKVYRLNQWHTARLVW
jgi:hypothetical protein